MEKEDRTGRDDLIWRGPLCEVVLHCLFPDIIRKTKLGLDDISYGIATLQKEEIEGGGR